MSLTYDQLVQVLVYDPETGQFRWRHRSDVPNAWNAKWAGRIAGAKARGGKRLYTQLMLHKRNYKAHRLAWLYMTGRWPDSEIDHIDCDGFNNKWSNLRLANRSQNGANSPAYSNNGCGVKGAHLYSGNGKYRARIHCKGRTHNLGYFDTPEEAGAVYAEAAKRLFGEYARSS